MSIREGMRSYLTNQPVKKRVEDNTKNCALLEQQPDGYDREGEPMYEVRRSVYSNIYGHKKITL